MLQDFLTGFTAVFRAIPLIARSATIRKRAWQPLLVNVIVIGVGLPISLWLCLGIIRRALPTGHWWSVPTSLLLVLLYSSVVAVVAFLILSAIAGSISGPKCTSLSRATERSICRQRGIAYHDNSLPYVTSILQGLNLAVARFLLFIGCYIPIFLTQFIVPPIGQIVFLLLSLVYGAFVVSLAYGDYVFERHYRRLSTKVVYLFGRKAKYLGFGIATIVLLLIPVLNLVALPICVVGITIVFVEDKFSAVAKAQPQSAVTVESQ